MKTSCGKFLNLAHYFPHDVNLRLLAHSRSFLANQKATNAIVGAENLLKGDIANIDHFSLLKLVPGLSTAMGLALALQANDRHTNDFTLAILRLHENRFLENLKRKWWETKVGCPQEHETSKGPAFLAIRICICNILHCELFRLQSLELECFIYKYQIMTNGDLE